MPGSNTGYWATPHPQITAATLERGDDADTPQPRSCQQGHDRQAALTPAMITRGSARPVSRSNVAASALWSWARAASDNPPVDPGGPGAAGEVAIEAAVAASRCLAREVDGGKVAEAVTNRKPVSSGIAPVQADRLAWLAFAGIRAAAMAPTTVPMKNGVSIEENAKVAPRPRSG